MQVRYFDECSWRDVGDGLIFHFVDGEGETLAEISLRDNDSKLWKWEIYLPDRYKFEGTTPAGYVHGQVAARKVSELILGSTIISK